MKLGSLKRRKFPCPAPALCAPTPPKLPRGTHPTGIARKRKVESLVRQVHSTALASVPGARGDGPVVRMEDLQYADKVAVGDGAHSDVLFFGRRSSHPVSEFVSIQHAVLQTPPRLSPCQYLYVDGKLRTARSVRPDDRLRGADSEYDLFVLNVKREQLRGLYAPKSVHGNLVVDGVVVSSYTDVMHPGLVHKLLHPLCLLY